MEDEGGSQTAVRNKRKLMIFGLRLDRSKIKKLEQHLPLLKNAPKPMNKYSALYWLNLSNLDTLKFPEMLKVYLPSAGVTLLFHLEIITLWSAKLDCVGTGWKKFYDKKIKTMIWFWLGLWDPLSFSRTYVLTRKKTGTA